MTKWTLLLMLAYLVATTVALGQSNSGPNPWNCKSSNNTHLICLLPVGTNGVFALNSPAPAINAAFATQLSELPILSPASGIIFTFDKSLGITVASDNLGPILTDRAHTIGKHKLLIAFGYQRFRFNSINGINLHAMPLVLKTSESGSSTLYTQETENVDFKLDQYVGLLTYGVTPKVDLSFILPLERVAIGAVPTSTNGIQNASVYLIGNGQPASGPVAYSHIGGSASGIGDVLFNVKWRFWSGERSSASAGLLLRFPTGDSLNYLGSGAMGYNPYVVYSYDARISPHVRLGYQFNGYTNLLPSLPPTGGSPTSLLPGGLQYNLGADYVLFHKVLTSFTGDYIGYYVRNSPILNSSTIGAAYNSLSSAFPNNPNVAPQEPAIIPGKTSYGSNQLSVGIKVKPVGNFLLYGNVLIQLNNVGLRSNPAPLIGASYTF